jgi:2-hydroxychromene-2-carboxylate isomerase
MAVTATLFGDPGCPWGYSADRCEKALRWRFGDQLEWELVMIGLAEEGSEYTGKGFTPEKMAGFLPMFSKAFGMPFQYEAKGHMSGTSQGCRAVVAAGLAGGTGAAFDAFHALQFMQFTTTGTLDSPDDIRAALAGVEGLDADAIVAAIDSPEVVEAYEEGRARARQAAGGPAEALGKTADAGGEVRYTAPTIVFTGPDDRVLEAGGMLPSEAYEMAIANLDPSIDRRDPPEGPAEALAAFPRGLTTAEVAEVMRPSGLPGDLAAARTALEELEASGGATRHPLGDDALWLAA